MHTSKASHSKWKATTLPRKVEKACQRLTRTMGLSFSGIDLKKTPDGEYYSFEVNPSPGFIFYERHTEQPISTALVELLRQGEPVRTIVGAPLGLACFPDTGGLQTAALKGLI